jgi:triosephosphate isomerase (TIM)
MREMIVAGNWKLNGSVAMANDLIQALKSDIDSTATVIVCPPASLLQTAQSACANSNIKVGAQNCSEHVSGAFTGELAASMVKEFADYVILGHSERRSLYAESSETVAQKFAQAQSNGLTPILCIGETLEQREAGETLNIVNQQLQAVIDSQGIQAFQHAVIAYEPVWAIGTGKTATPEQAQETHHGIREFLKQFDLDIAQKVSILYGGSVKADNAAELFAQNDIDGGLIGGAALKAEQFIAICNAAG